MLLQDTYLINLFCLVLGVLIGFSFRGSIQKIIKLLVGIDKVQEMMDDE